MKVMVGLLREKYWVMYEQTVFEKSNELIKKSKGVIM